MNKKVLRYNISKYSLYIFIFCALYLLQRFIVVAIFEVEKYIIFNKVYTYEIVLFILTFIEVYKGIKISRLE